MKYRNPRILNVKFYVCKSQVRNKRDISVIFDLLKLLYRTTVDKKAYELSNITTGRPHRTNCFLLCECIEYSNMNILILALAVCTHTRPL